ncbi:phthiocerol/phthiodiolone dimycocerosyl transferase family protein [Paraburkholderia sp. 2C]
MMMILEDLLRALSGKPLRAPFKEAASPSDFLSLPANCRYRTSLDETARFSAPDAKHVRVERISLSETLTAAVLAQCKARAVNVRALMAAVIAAAGREGCAEWQSRPVTVASPIDLRYMRNQEEIPGLLVGVAFTAVPVATSRDTLWQTAESIGQALQHATNLEAQRATVLKFRQITEDERPPLAFAEAWQHTSPGADIMINNYGRLAVQDDYDAFRVRSLSSASLAAMGKTQKVSMISLRGRIGLCIATCQPIPGLLGSVSHILASVCGTSLH